jgi:hypothetical protein
MEKFSYGKVQLWKVQAMESSSYESSSYESSSYESSSYEIVQTICYVEDGSKTARFEARTRPGRIAGPGFVRL